MNIRQWLKANKEKYKDDRVQGMKACVKVLNASYKGVQKVAAQEWPYTGNLGRKGNSVGPVAASLMPKSSKKDIMCPDTFLSGVDIVQHVMDFLESDVKDGYIEDEKLRRRFEIGTGKWSEIKRLPLWEGRFFVYQKSNGQRATVWSSKKGIELARKTISMARYEV